MKRKYTAFLSIIFSVAALSGCASRMEKAPQDIRESFAESAGWETAGVTSSREDAEGKAQGAGAVPADRTGVEADRTDAASAADQTGVGANRADAADQASDMVSDYVNMAPHVSAEMLQADYWIRRAQNPGQLIMTEEEIEAFNTRIWRKMMEDGGPIYDLDRLLEDAGDYRASLLQSCEIPRETYYHNGIPVKAGFWKEIFRNRDAEGMRQKAVPGICVQRGDLRIYPTDEVLNSNAGSIETDAMQNSGVLLNEPVVVLEVSKDGKWYFICTYFAYGWIHAEDVAICASAAQWREAQEMEHFLVVTGDKIFLEEDPEQTEISGMELYMGTRLALLKKGEYPAEIGRRAAYDNYVVKLPVRNTDGKLFWRYGLVPVSRDVHIGYLPYTTENVLKQAFKIHGNRYGWGGMYHARDCSAYAMELYRCFGILLPRDSGPQSMIDCDKLVWDDSVTEAERLETLKDVPPGAILRLPGHIMIYLGIEEGEAYCINAAGSFVPEGGTAAVPVRTVTVNTLSVRKRDGKTWLKSLTEVIMPR